MNQHFSFRIPLLPFRISSELLELLFGTAFLAVDAICWNCTDKLEKHLNHLDTCSLYMTTYVTVPRDGGHTLSAVNMLTSCPTTLPS